MWFGIGNLKSKDTLNKGKKRGSANFDPWATKYDIKDFIGASAEIKEIKRVAFQVAQTSATVLITGESGTGKEVLAHYIHSVSPRKDNRFVWIDCSAIPRELLESELFGYESGSFTGADTRGKKGKFELAHRGSILLDEIADMPLEMQVKVLRVLQENEFIRIGGTKPRRVDLRVIAITNKDIDKLVREDLFRNDLFYRLDVARINIPALRYRQDDIPILAKHFLTMFEKKYNKYSIELSANAIKSLKKYNWPGNVRELRNLIEKTVILAEPKKVITSIEIPTTLLNNTLNLKESMTKVKESIKEMEKVKILEALKKTNYNKTEAAKLLGIHRSGLYQKLNKYGIKKHRIDF